MHTLLNCVVSNDLELGLLSKIFNGTKRRAVSLRQLSFLYSFTGDTKIVTNVETAEDVKVLQADLNELFQDCQCKK